MATTYTNPSDMVSSGIQAYDTTTGAITGRTITGTAGQITVTNGSGTGGNPTLALATSLSGIAFNYTGTAVSPYDVLSTDFTVGVDCSGGAKIVRLPNAPTAGSIWVVKDALGACTAVNTITITTVGGAVNIDAATTYVMTLAWASITVQWNGTRYIVI